MDASFPGGSAAWLRYLEENLQKEFSDSIFAQTTNWTVVVRFVVGKDGSISNVKVPMARKHSLALVSEAIRVIQNSPRWNPATRKGKPARSYMQQSIVWIPAGNE